MGYVYGFWVGLPLIMVAWLANAVAACYIGSHAARPVLFAGSAASASNGSNGWPRTAV